MVQSTAPPNPMVAGPTPQNNETRAGYSQMLQSIHLNPVVAAPDPFHLVAADFGASNSVWSKQTPPEQLMSNYLRLNAGPPAVATRPLDVVPIANPTPQPLPIDFQQLAGVGAYSPSLMDASLWTDAEVVVGADGMARVIPLPRATEPPAVAIAEIGAATQQVAFPADAVAVAPTPPTAPSSNCEQCGDEVAGDYSSRRRHVFERHAFQQEATKLATQEALKEAIGKCFPEAVVRNDLMCNHPGCGMEVTLYKGKTGEVLQKFHIQHFHLRVVAEDICPLSCPVHKGMKSQSERDKAACEQLLDWLDTAASHSLRQFFPHTPIGVLCLGVRNKRGRDGPSTARIETRLPWLDSASRPRLESVGQELEIADCRECGEAVSTSYTDRRQHVIERHMEGRKLPGTSVLEQQNSLKMAIMRCFPDATVANDLMCNRCGMEVKDLAGQYVQALQNEHVQQYHIDSVGEGAEVGCPINGCTKTLYPIPHMRALRYHIKACHGGVRKLIRADKVNYEQLCDRVMEATNELLPTHFPFTPNGFLTRKRKAPLEIDEADGEELRRLAWD